MPAALYQQFASAFVCTVLAVRMLCWLSSYVLCLFCPSDTLFMLDPFSLLDGYVTFCGDATAVSEVVGADLTLLYSREKGRISP
jgi:hypothetical protein